MSLPAVPQGANPFTVYLAALEAEVYPPMPPPSFRARLLVLMAICVYGTLVCAAYGIYLFVQHRRKPTADRRKHAAFATLIDGYICVNLHTCIALLGFVSLVAMGFYTAGEYCVFELRRGLGFVNTWRSFLWIPIVLQGYLVSMASFQSFLIVASRAGQRVPSPRAANATFLVLLGAITLALVTTDTVLAFGWQSLWHAIMSVRTLLETDAAVWSPAGPTNVVQLFALLARSDAISDRKVTAYQQQVAVLTALIVCCAVVALANVGSSLLLISIRRQISSHTARLRQLASPLAHASFNLHMSAIAVVLPSPGSGFESGEKIYQGESRVEWGALAAAGEGVSKAVAGDGEPVPGAKGQEDGPGDKWWARAGRRKSSLASNATVVQSDGLRSLKRAERELLLCVVSVLFFSLSYLGEVMWDLITLRDDLSWYSLELSYFFVDWTFSLGLSGAVTTLCVLAGKDCWAQRRRSVRDSLAVQPDGGLCFIV